MKKALLATLCVLAAGCSTHGQVNPDVMQIATTPLTCSNATECRSLVATRADLGGKPFDLQDRGRERFADPDRRARLAANARWPIRSRKTPNNDGTATIGFAAHCDSSLGCKPNPWEAGADFKEFVRSGVAGSPAPQNNGATAPATATPPSLEAAPAQSVGTPGDVPVSQ